jgi:hypothetical protein
LPGKWNKFSPRLLSVKIFGKKRKIKGLNWVKVELKKKSCGRICPGDPSSSGKK